MRERVLHLVALLSISTCLVLAEEPEFIKEEHVVVLTDANFDTYMSQHSNVLVAFVAPWCGHCKNLAADYSNAATRLDTPLAKLDATAEKEVAKRFDIQGFPTIKFFKNATESKPIDFDGGRDADSIVEWVKQKTDPNYKPPPEDAITLTVETFDEFITDKPIMLVAFTAPWCGHCKRLAPEYEKAAKRLKAHKIPLAKVDATTEKSLADKYGVNGYPTLKILRNGKRFDFDGPRDADGIVKYMLTQSEPATRELRTVLEASRFINTADVTIIGFFVSAADSPTFEAFADAAESVRGEFASIGYTTDPSVFKHYGAKPNDIILFRPKLFASEFDEPKKVFRETSFGAEELVKFWRESAPSLVGLRTRENVATRYGKNPLVVIYYAADFSVEHREGSEYWRKKILPIANKYKSTYRFAISSEEEFAPELQATGLDDSGLEHNVIAFGYDGKKYPMRPEVYDEDSIDQNLAAFMRDLNAGKARAFVKSAPLPASNSGPIRTLVASNFESTLSDETKDYLIEFYAPWCGHCKAFETKYVELAKRLKSEKQLVLAKFDATTNDPHEDYKVEGFPTIYFAPGGLKHKPVKYSGNRDLDDLTNFMKKNAKNTFKTKEEL